MALHLLLQPNWSHNCILGFWVTFFFYFGYLLLLFPYVGFKFHWSRTMIINWSSSVNLSFDLKRKEKKNIIKKKGLVLTDGTLIQFLTTVFDSWKLKHISRRSVSVGITAVGLKILPAAHDPNQLLLTIYFMITIYFSCGWYGIYIKWLIWYCTII